MAQHSHASASSGSGHRTRLAAAFLITAGIVVAQLVGAWVAGSLALLTDAVHSFTDTIGLGVALIAATLMFRAATATRTWGFRRVEILAGFLQAALLLGVGVYAAVEGIGRLSDPPEVAHVELMIFGILGLVGNIASMAVLNASRKDNFNVRAAFLEVTADALGSLGVVVAAAVIWTTGWQQADAAAALVIAALIIPRALKLMVETARILLEFAPKGLDLEEVRKHMLQLEHVEEVHDLHASIVATGLPVISAHVVVDDSCFREGCAPDKLAELQACVAEHFEVPVQHSTFQLETRDIAASETHTHA